MNTVRARAAAAPQKRESDQVNPSLAGGFRVVRRGLASRVGRPRKRDRASQGLQTQNLSPRDRWPALCTLGDHASRPFRVLARLSLSSLSRRARLAQTRFRSLKTSNGRSIPASSTLPGDLPSSTRSNSSACTQPAQSSFASATSGRIAPPERDASRLRSCQSCRSPLQLDISRHPDSGGHRPGFNRFWRSFPRRSGRRVRPPTAR